MIVDSAHGSHNASGYTLLEMLVVLSILALVSGIGLRYTLSPPTGLSLSAAAHAIASEAERARLLALQQSREVVLMVDVERREVRIEGQKDAATAPKDASIALTAAAPEVRSAGLGGIRFFPDGTSTGGDIRVTWRGGTKVVRVDWLVARARVSDD